MNQSLLTLFRQVLATALFACIALFFSITAFSPSNVFAVDGEINYSGVNTDLTGDDVGTGPFNLGFTFNYYGTNYTQAYININGTVTFGSNYSAYSNGALSGSGANNTIYAFWDDLNTNKSGGPSGNKPIYYATIGEAPNRKFLVQWTDIYFHGTTVQLGTFQAILYEGSNDIQIQYRDLLGGARALGNSATIGIKKDGSTYEQYSNELASLTQGQAIRYSQNGSNDYNVNASSTYELAYILPPGAPVSPTLVNPTNNTTGVTLRPTFEWLQVASATSYTVLVSTQSNFSSTVVNASGVTGSSYTLGSDLSASTQYYWRVQSVNSVGGSLSSTRTFTTGSSNTAPSSPTNSTSTTFLGGATPGSVSGGTITTELSDPDDAEQVRYRLQIATDIGFSNLALDYRSPFAAEGPATFTFAENAGTYLVGSATTTLSAGSYYVRLRAEDDAAASSDWVTSGSIAFTIVADTTAPVISELSVTDLASTTAEITWTTNESASSRIEYGPSSQYGTTTNTFNTSPRVTAHSVVLSELSPCIAYHYRIYTTDASSNIATSSNAAFTTKGCTADALVITQSDSEAVATSTGGVVDLVQDGKGISLDVPASFSSSTTGSIYFQIKRINDETVDAAVGKPESTLNRVSGHTYALNAITDGLVSLVEFDEPITITISYASEDIEGVEESTLRIYRWNGTSWTMLSDCSVDTAAKTVMCTTDHFSTFSLFGDPTPSTSQGNVQQSSTSGSGSVTTVQGQVWNLIQIGNLTAAKALYTKWSHLSYSDEVLKILGVKIAVASAQVSSSTTSIIDRVATASSTVFNRNLYMGLKGEDVRSLQVYLNKSGFVIAESGPGSIGNETEVFGSKTRSALIKFQKVKSIHPAIGFFGPITRAAIDK